MSYHHIKIKAVLLLSVCFMVSCRKFLDIGTPESSIARETVFSSDKTALGAVTAIYHQLQVPSNFASGRGVTGISNLAGMSADEFALHLNSGTVLQFYRNELTDNNASVQGLWVTAYNTIYMANAVIEGLDASQAVSVGLKAQLQGEAMFIRAFCYSYLVNCFGDVPLLTGTDYRVNTLASRVPAAQVYQQIMADLDEAKSRVADNYPSADRIRPNKAVVSALLARVHLYLGNWAQAEAEAGSLISNSAAFSLLADPDEVFKKNSQETIWQLLPLASDMNTYDGNYFILTANPAAGLFNSSLTAHLLNAFEAGDARRTNWVGTLDIPEGIFYFPYKYKIKTGADLSEYSVLFRLGEQYLIRAEARAQLNNIAGAQTDVNAIRSRAQLGDTPANDKASLLLAIEQERRVELFSEWGHRWFDLKRTGRADAVLSPIKAPTWQPTDVLYPIPLTDRINNPNLTQNNGY